MSTVNIQSRYLADISYGELKAKFSADRSRVLRWYIDFRHKLLHIHKELSAPELFILQHKIDVLMGQWDQKADEQKRRNTIFSGKHGADQMTVDAAARLDQLSRILAHTLKVNGQVDWSSLKDFRKFDEPETFNQSMPHRVRTQQPVTYEPTISLWDRIFGRAKKIQAGADVFYEQELANWKTAEAQADADIRRRTAEWTAQKAEYESTVASKKAKFLSEQSASNSHVNLLAANVALGDPQAVIEHASLVLDSSNYGDLFDPSFEVDYDPASKTVMVDYQLPSPDEMPTVKTVRFVPATGELRETHISDREQKSNYDLACYQICLRTIHELFEADEHENTQRVLFNGGAMFVDRATGQNVTSLILSIVVNRSEFLAIDLSRVDPKACFKSLKGVSASSLAAMAPVPAVLVLNREDKRFVDPRETLSGVDDASNLASMDWEQFEHLVREVFEKEFSRRGGEVKITQSSRDGGVDAVAFDPDPLTGGKIVIQAKRYTRTVGVAAIRDLYGTMQHEGASRGILVTTADYGPDAHSFALGKHITLMTGGNLLHLLDRHGIRAKIDIREARKMLNLRDNHF